MYELIPGIEELDDVIDKLYALVAYRSLFIDPNIQAVNREGNPVNMTVSVILDQLENFEAPGKDTLRIDSGFIEYGPISVLPGEDDDLYKCVTHINFADVSITKQEEIWQVINKLPTAAFSKLNARVLALYKEYENLELIPENTNTKLDALTINLLSEQCQNFLLSLYKRDMNSVFETIFVFSQHFRNLDYFEMSPLDSRVLENILHKEVKEAKKQSERQEHTNPLTPQL